MHFCVINFYQIHPPKVKYRNAAHFSPPACGSSADDDEELVLPDALLAADLNVSVLLLLLGFSFSVALLSTLTSLCADEMDACTAALAFMLLFHGVCAASGAGSSVDGSIVGCGCCDGGEAAVSGGTSVGSSSVGTGLTGLIVGCAVCSVGAGLTGLSVGSAGGAGLTGILGCVCVGAGLADLIGSSVTGVAHGELFAACMVDDVLIKMFVLGGDGCCWKGAWLKLVLRLAACHCCCCWYCSH